MERGQCLEVAGEDGESSCGRGGHRTCGRTVRQSRLVADSVSAPSSLSRSSFTLGLLKLQLRGRGLYMSRVDVKVKVQRGPSSTPRLLTFKPVLRPDKHGDNTRTYWAVQMSPK